MINSVIYQNDIQKAIAQNDFSSLEGKKFFITGATGLICSALVDVLIALKEKGLRIDIIAAGRSVKRSEYTDHLIQIP